MRKNKRNVPLSSEIIANLEEKVVLRNVWIIVMMAALTVVLIRKERAK
nr:MAG TPA: hypothetical protein [Caudoviricetes sp.]